MSSDHEELRLALTQALQAAKQRESPPSWGFLYGACCGVPHTCTDSGVPR